MRENFTENAKKVPNELKDFSEYLFRPKYFFWRNLLAGFARGLGVFLGLTLGAAIFAWVIGQIVDFPVIGQYFERILEILEAGTISAVKKIVFA